jgi:putative chitinase
MLTIELLKKMWPHGDQNLPGLMKGMISGLPDAFKKYDIAIDDDLVLAHFLAQWSEECGAGIEMVENMNYSAQGLVRTWPTRFGADRAAKFAHNPQMIAEAVYGGRMGNDPAPSHDGWFYRGRGLSQLTGKENYYKVEIRVDMDLVADPDLVNAPVHAVMIACADMIELCSYENKNCLAWAKVDDVVGVTRALNGGLIGLADRRDWLRRWKAALAVEAEKSPTVAVQTHAQPAA